MRKPDEVQSYCGLTFLLGSMGVSLALPRTLCCPLSNLVALQPPVGKSHKEHLSRGGDGAVRGRGSQAQVLHQLRSQREEWKPIFSFYFFGGENHTLFWTHLPTPPPSLERLTVSAIL